MKKPKVDIKDIKYYVNVVLMCLLAFAAGYVVSPHMGKYSSFLLLIPIAAASGFVRTNVLAKAAVFAACAYLLSSLYGGTPLRCALCAALCAVCAVACHYAAELILAKKALLALAGVIIIMLTVVPHVFVLGSPFEAAESDRSINEYFAANYDADEYRLSELQFDFSSRRFYAQITPEYDLSVKFPVWYSRAGLTDECLDYLKARAMNDARIRIVTALRAKYPDGRYEVVAEKAVNVFENGLQPGNMVFSIYISAYVTDAEFVRLARAYTAAAKDAGADFAYLVFYGGHAGSYYRTLTLRGEPEFEKCTPEFISPLVPTRFFEKFAGPKLADLS
ncbi:MAG: hypothetical protein IJK33_03525 [Clostridia bacterium]|nr:hypothetical protein [Clostridia bacterium]